MKTSSRASACSLPHHLQPNYHVSPEKPNHYPNGSKGLGSSTIDYIWSGGLVEVGEDPLKSSWAPSFMLIPVSELGPIRSHANATMIYQAPQYSQFQQGFLAYMCVNIYSYAAPAPTLSPCVFLAPKWTSTPWVWAAGEHSAETATQQCPREPKQARKQCFYSGSSVNMQMLGYPSLVTQQTQMALYAPSFQDCFVSNAMVSLILFRFFFLHPIFWDFFLLLRCHIGL